MKAAFCSDLHINAKNNIRIIEGLNFLDYLISTTKVVLFLVIRVKKCTFAVFF